MVAASRRWVAGLLGCEVPESPGWLCRRAAAVRKSDALLVCLGWRIEGFSQLVARGWLTEGGSTDAAPIAEARRAVPAQHGSPRRSRHPGWSPIPCVCLIKAQRGPRLRAKTWWMLWVPSREDSERSGCGWVNVGKREKEEPGDETRGVMDECDALRGLRLR